ncbi:hypothetical protein VNI00_015802 [Paramarasmius palmivorus]|uniref:Glycoside hydrolase family 76 protein n=1 Tax=Paramarasmius palmivorus TaxID=297713 RepID=A0AAW0BIA1_9AGAR
MESKPIKLSGFQLQFTFLQKPMINITVQDRIDTAGAALDMMLRRGIPNNNRTPNFYSQLAEFDIATNQTKYREWVSGYFLNGPPGYDNTPLYAITNLGYVALRAYMAYKDEKFLDFAVKSWEVIKQHAYLNSGVPPPFQNLSRARSALEAHIDCENSVDLTGGILFYPKIDILASENMRFLRLSGLLREVTGNDTYLQAAQQAADMIFSHLRTRDSLWWWQTSINMSSPCEVVIDEKTTPWNSGYAVEGLAILASVWPNETIQERLRSSIFESTRKSDWHDSRGIIATGDNQTGDLNFVRGLSTARSRLSNSSDLFTYLEGYLAVQYNAVLDLAGNQTNMYADSWIGPPTSQYSADSQVQAAEVLIAGIRLAFTYQSTMTLSTLPIAGIVGGMLGGLFLVVLLTISVLFVIRHRRRQHGLLSITPYTLGRHTQDSPSQTQLTRLPRSEKNRNVDNTSNDAPIRSESSSQVRSEPPSTSELVRMLYQRLQPDRWRGEEEQLPEYTSALNSR